MRKKLTKKIEKNLLVGLDIGTSKVVTLVGEVDLDGKINLISIGSHPSKGLKRGVVVNIDSTVASIQSSVEMAENTAECQIHSAYTGISGSHVKSFNSHGIVAIRDQEVTQADVDRVLDAARAVAIPADQKILHVLPQEYIIDNQGGIREPIGMSGVRLEANVHMVTGSVSAAQNIVKCIKRCGLEVADVILEQLASSYAVLSEDEKELGVCLVDIGAGTTDIAVFVDGAIRHTAVIPIAGDQVTSDIAVALRTPTASAEAIKMKYASALAEDIPGDETIEVDGVGERPGRTISRKHLAEVVEARYEELFNLVKAELKRSGFERRISAGIVLTGGASSVEGGLVLAESIFKLPVRLGVPMGVSGLPEIIHNPSYATGVGLLLYALQEQNAPLPEEFSGAGVKALLARMKAWFGSNF
ncbi:MAG: cell division protein FtsA [Gammaproteobacteria bacterium]|jgi:cell division protein FtsA|nr:cell division protein FtsA [Gammaproteobacteria bacterium]